MMKASLSHLMMCIIAPLLMMMMMLHPCEAALRGAARTVQGTPPQKIIINDDLAHQRNINHDRSLVTDPNPSSHHDARALQNTVADGTINIAGIFDTAAFDWGHDIFEAVVAFLNDPADGWHDEIFDAGQFNIHFEIANSGCDPSQAAEAYWDLRTKWQGDIDAIVGCRCSGASNMVSTFSGLEDIPQISMSSTSASFTENGNDYPLFSRTVSPDNESGQVGAMVGMLRGLGWNQVQIVTTDKQFSKDLANRFRSLWEQDGEGTAYQATSITLIDDPDDADEEVVDPQSVQQVLKSLPGRDSEQNSRVILLLAHDEHASQIIEMADKDSLVREDAIWVAPQAWAARVIPRYIPQRPSAHPGYLGLTPYRNKNYHFNDFLNRFNDYHARRGGPRWTSSPDYAVETMVDAIVAMVKAIAAARADMSSPSSGSAIMEKLVEVKFIDGVSGPVSFTANGDRENPRFSILNLRRYHDSEWDIVGNVQVRSSGDIAFEIDEDSLCFPGSGCGVIPTDSDPVPKEEYKLPIWVPLLLAAVTVAFCAILFKYQMSKIKKRRLQDQMDKMAKQLEHQMQGIVKATHNLPFQDARSFTQRWLEVKAQSDITGAWYWEEDADFVSRHDASTRLPGTNFVTYGDEISLQIEHAYQLWKEGKGYQVYDVDLTNKVQKVNNAHTGLRYKLDFADMTQANATSNHKRAIRREDATVDLRSDIIKSLPALPATIDTDNESLLPTVEGQVIQITKVHPDEKNWAFGNVLYDPLVEDAAKAGENQTAGSTTLNTVLADALHSRSTSGWFPTAVTEPADIHVMKSLVGSMGDEVSALNPPSTWKASHGGNLEFEDGRLEVPPASQEYQDIASYFETALYTQKSCIEVVKIERVQNLPLWQTYAVKKQTIKSHYQNHPSEHNPGTDGMERQWLFHGTTESVVEKIERQGFNRAFAGRNAVRYGKGVYFARDASYSSHTTYSAPNSRGVQQMFMCRVVVGDWCQGKEGQLTPDAKPHNQLELFDSTVDNVLNPSIFVVYHDAQAYPEYLISFRRKG
eukprot:CAMPEP_0119552200 /NCGR_PEP_ID=MMETSP1352-20130426/5261_1 /TAXON_ID=265584 /ORGANISM="Stauroneis constricta, Strain CCMP1120" /LENGTH=1034 /DNA_ID=CAMNT_0007598393 /DNA_START=93 /DNA_END=3197 /DNA_ORIENTATION=-